MKMSFCITAMNRRLFIEQALPRNMRLADDPAKYEFVLLDYNSHDDLARYVQANCVDAIARGSLCYYRTDDPARFCASHAKNCSHRLATGDILVNLDADNLLAPAFLAHLETLQRGELLKTHGHYSLGGRLSMHRSDFDMMGGYDEDMTHGWGGEDEDLVTRGVQLGFVLRSVEAQEAGSHIEHSDLERVRHCEMQDKAVSWKTHREITASNIARGRLIANSGRAWGTCRVTKNFGELIPS